MKSIKKQLVIVVCEIFNFTGAELNWTGKYFLNQQIKPFSSNGSEDKSL